MRTINLNSLENSKIDLGGFTGNVMISGIYRGPAIVIINARNVNIVSDVAIIDSTDEENAIVLQDPRHVKILGGKLLRLNQSITVWGKAIGLTISNVQIVGAHTGIRINTPESHTSIYIRNCIIKGCDHEGIYVGPHYETRHKLVGVTVDGCIIEGNGWDGLQTGNTSGFDIKNCVIRGNALRREPGQDFEVTINPGSRGHIWKGNTIEGAIQSLESRLFMYKR